MKPLLREDMTELKSIYLLVKPSSAKITYVASLGNHYQSWKRRPLRPVET